MSQEQHGSKTRHGRVIKPRGMDAKKFEALDKMKALKEGSLNPLDQYQIEEERQMFQYVDNDEYQQIQEQRRNDDFIVDDEGYGYADKGGEIWEHHDDRDAGDGRRSGAGTKKRKLNQKGNQDIGNFMAPVSALANQKRKIPQSHLQKSVDAKVSEAQSKDIMADLLGELDQQDADDLQLHDVNQMAAANAAMYAANGITTDDHQEAAFNMDDNNNMKYNVAVGAIQENRATGYSSATKSHLAQQPDMEQMTGSAGAPEAHDAEASASKKRNFNEITKISLASIPQRRHNPFAKDTLNGSASARKSDQNDQGLDQINSASGANGNGNTFGSDQQAKETLEIPQKDAAEETAIEKEWKEVKKQNELERAQMMDQNRTSQQFQNFDHPLKFNEDGSLSFFWFDAHEENYGADIYLFGKVWQPEVNAFVSCSLRVQGMERTIFALPKMKQNKARGSLSEAEEKAQQQSMIMEFNQLRQSRFKNITGFKCKFVSRKYAFEMPISHGEHKFLKIKYPATQPPLPQNLTGNTFECLFGANQSMLELFILKRRIKGPCWLTIKNVQSIKNLANFKATWCKQECVIQDPKNVEVTIDDMNKQSPPMTCLSFSLKTTRSTKHNTNEIAMISCLVHTNINQDGPTNSIKMQKFTMMRKLDQRPLPFDLQQKLKQKTDAMVHVFSSEKQMIEALIGRLHQVDPDVLLAHNLCGSVFELLMARIQNLNVPHWSRIGRMKRGQIPTRKSDQSGYSGSQWIPRMVSCGRLLVDTFVSSKELVRETSYDLGHLAKKQLKTVRIDYDDDMLPEIYKETSKLLQLVNHTETDTFLTFKLMLHFNILPLTKQLTTIAGNLWFRSLQNARAERNEMLLLHEFRARKFLCPDKKTFNQKEAKKHEFGDDDQNETKAVGGKGKRQKAKYGGGLVLDPIAGFYDNIILLLDFNSLYPSIIQEYNLCFTTVDRKHTKNFDGSQLKADKALNAGEEVEDEFDAEDADLPSGNAATKDAILPNVLKNLVQKRRMVKAQMKQEKDEVKYQQLNIRQTALKLTANSMYGCLGFSSSRFHAQAIASLITRTGRETLMKTKEIAENKLGFSVIYGDTDSIMINTGTNSVKEALEMGQKLKVEVNVLYKCLEIEIDGIFKSMLLLKKKKYAALVVENYGKPDEKITTELKGLDMVRRDWCPLSKNVGNFVLKEILSGKQREDIVMSLNEYLSNVGQKMKKGETPLSEYIITKQLTRPTTEYSEPKSLPHVQVAIRMKSQGKSDADLVNNFIPYVICKTEAEKGKKIYIGDMAYSPEEFLDKRRNLEIDVDWYILQQLLPPITRLIEHIEGIEVDFVAQCLGVDGKKYNYNKGQNVADEDDGLASISNPIMKTETTGKLQERSIASLKIQCPFCEESYDFPEIMHSKGKAAGQTSNICPNEKCLNVIPAQIIKNRARLFIKQLEHMYYRGEYVCKEHHCKNETRKPLINNRCAVVGCKGRVRAANVSEEKANDTLRYLEGLFNLEKYQHELKLNKNRKQEDMKLPAHLTSTLENVKPLIDGILAKSKYNKVDLNSLFGFMNFQKPVIAAD